MIMIGLFILGVVCAIVTFGLQKIMDLFCVSMTIVGLGIFLYYGFFL